MLDKQTFMENLHDVMEIAKISDHPLSREEIMVYFEGMELSKEQEELIYSYLQKQPLTEEEEKEEEEDTDSAREKLMESNKQQKEAEKAFLQSPYVKMYCDDISTIKKLEEEELLPYYDALLAGEETAAAIVIENYLERVLELAKRYVTLDVTMSDVLQEGNMALILAVNRLKEEPTENVREYLEHEVKQAMEQYIDEMLADSDWQQVLLSRAQLLNDAKQALTKEKMHIPGTKELSEYTHLSEEEIADLLALIKEKKEKQ